ncbi:MAG TPA: ACT domain-containing protein [Candidatus Margulisiibacteriota bacterium]|nr:ACT domain-containing protein [Candidatus Margulisiibacteriota bacterium]
MAKSLAVISVIGRDQKGVVARVSTYLASCNINIEDIEQRVMEGLFIMTMLVDLNDLSINLDELILGLKRIGDEIHMDVAIRLHGRKEPKRVAILVSREPQCLQRLIADRDEGRLNGDVVVVLSNHEILRPLAEQHQIPFFASPSTDKPAHEAFLLEKLKEYQVDLVVLARYMQILSPAVVERYPNRIINIHPSLLPYHPGSNAYKQAYEEGVRVSGCTAHFVTEQLDQGPVIIQDVFHIRVGEDTLEAVRARGQELEAKVLSQAVQLFLNDQLVVKDKKVIFRPGIAPNWGT